MRGKRPAGVVFPSQHGELSQRQQRQVPTKVENLSWTRMRHGTLPVQAPYVDGQVPVLATAVRSRGSRTRQLGESWYGYMCWRRGGCRPGSTTAYRVPYHGVDGIRGPPSGCDTGLDRLDRRDRWPNRGAQTQPVGGQPQPKGGMTGGQEMGMPRAGDVSDLPVGGGGRIRLRIAGHGTWKSVDEHGRAWTDGLCVAIHTGETRQSPGRWATVWGFAGRWGVSAWYRPPPVPGSQGPSPTYLLRSHRSTSVSISGPTTHCLVLEHTRMYGVRFGRSRLADAIHPVLLRIVAHGYSPSRPVFAPSHLT
ncbi:hypothetical protein J3F83DRAFT_755460 [Trichoderma novae-zelandiae]